MFKTNQYINFYHYSKIAICLCFAFIFSHILAKYIFVGYSPQYRNNLPLYMRTVVNHWYAKIENKDMTQGERPLEARIEYLKNTLNQIAPGVRANYDEGTSYVEYNFDTVAWDTVTVTLSDGRMVTVQFPKGQMKPSKEALQQTLE